MGQGHSRKNSISGYGDSSEDEAYPSSKNKGEFVDTKSKIVSVSEINRLFVEKQQKELEQLRKRMVEFLDWCHEDIYKQIESRKTTLFFYEFRVLNSYCDKEEIDKCLVQIVKDNLESKQWHVRLVNNGNASMKNKLDHELDIRSDNDKIRDKFNYVIQLQTGHFISGATGCFYETTKKIYLVEICVICKEKISEQILNPCGHLCVCTECCRQMVNPKQCPICKTLISGSRTANSNDYTACQKVDEFQATQDSIIESKKLEKSE